MLPSTAEYALRAVIHLASHGNGDPIRVNEIADAVGVPRNYLSKIFHELAREGVLASTRGKLGGFQLAVPPEQLPLAQIVGRFTHLGGDRTCLLGRDSCSDRTPCLAHGRWKAISEDLTAFFRETTVADLLRDAPATTSTD